MTNIEFAGLSNSALRFLDQNEIDIDRSNDYPDGAIITKDGRVFLSVEQQRENQGNTVLVFLALKEWDSYTSRVKGDFIFPWGNLNADISTVDLKDQQVVVYEDTVNLGVECLSASELIHVAEHQFGVVGKVPKDSPLIGVPSDLMVSGLSASWELDTKEAKLVLIPKSKNGHRILINGIRNHLTSLGIDEKVSDAVANCSADLSFYKFKAFSTLAAKILSSERLMSAFEKYPPVIDGKVNRTERGKWLKQFNRTLFLNTDFPELDLSSEVAVASIAMAALKLMKKNSH